MTTYSKLLEMGYTDADIRGAVEELDARTFSIGVTDTPDGDPIVGIVYMCDWRAEEEWSVGEMRKLFEDAKKRTIAERFAGTGGQKEYVHLTEGGYVVFGTQDPNHYTLKNARQYWYTHRAYAQKFKQMQTYRMTVKELRTWAKEHGLPLTKMTKRDQIESAVVNHYAKTATPEAPNRFPGYFHSGLPLVLKAEGVSVVRDVLALMIVAAQKNTLGVSGGGGAFSSGFGFYDLEDVGPKLQAELDASAKFYKEEMDKLAPVQKELENKGYGIYFLGKPTDMWGPTKYWMNGHSSKCAKQPFGWYTLEELKAEKFAADAQAEVDNRNKEG